VVRVLASPGAFFPLSFPSSLAKLIRRDSSHTLRKRSRLIGEVRRFDRARHAS
jgi:hypothetical protein